MSKYSEKIIEYPYENIDENINVNLINIVKEFNSKLIENEFTRDLDDNDPLSKFISEKTNQIMFNSEIGNTSRYGDNLILYKNEIWIQENKSMTIDKKSINMGKQLISNYKIIPLKKIKQICLKIKEYPLILEKIKKLSNNFNNDIKLQKFYSIFLLNKSFQRESKKIKIIANYVIENILENNILKYKHTYKTNLYYTNITKDSLIPLNFDDTYVINSDKRDRGSEIGLKILKKNNIVAKICDKQTKGYDIVDSQNKKYEVKVYKYNSKGTCLQFESNNPLLKENGEIDYLIVFSNESWKNNNIIHIKYAGFLKLTEIKIKKRITYRRWFEINL